ncbi:stathmin domain-containing protein 1-like isoform X1 [Sinocyclocheilus rhinocerous]|uniref:stathmin domain-containing protein 1-like isoform X1 n=2 Tax=Sinocyclocheilus rhinocerous TaxID=307959 RepID=UPI0007BA1D33|nr:PREDICTED: stathmin domain-containing protein 1-like isoform X1 [Sinocyclocheilus rhinocerous]
MGCGSSKITVVEPVKPRGLNGNETETLEFVVQGGSRGDSAVSKMTTDSGVSLDAAEPTVLPGSVPRMLPPLQAQSPGLAQQSEERPDSSEILEQLLVQGIIPAQPRQGGSGEAYNIMMDDAEKPKRRPARLESLKIRKEQEVTRKEDIEMKMRQVEERRKEKEDLKRRLRIKSARPSFAAPVTADGELDPLELLHSEQLPVPTRTKQLQSMEPVNGESEDQRLNDSPELENDSTFQQTEDTDEGF